MGTNYMSIFALLMRLRQACLHPYLLLQANDSKRNALGDMNDVNNPWLLSTCNLTGFVCLGS